MKPLNFGSPTIYNVAALFILLSSSVVSFIGSMAQIVFVALIGICALALLVHSSIILARTTSESTRNICKRNILYSCAYVTASLIPVAISKVIYALL